MTIAALLIDGLASATGPSRELDGEIAEFFGEQAPADPAGWPPAYTASLDVALTLCPAGWRWYVADSDDKSGDLSVASVFTTEVLLTSGSIPRSVGATPAIALSLAAIKVRAAGGAK